MRLIWSHGSLDLKAKGPLPASANFLAQPAPAFLDILEHIEK